MSPERGASSSRRTASLSRENGMAAAQSETDRVTREAEAARLQSVAAAQDVKLETEARAAADQAEADRLKRESESRIAAAGVEADRLKRENLEQKAASQAELDSAAAAAAVEADRLKRVNQEQQAASQAELDSAAKDKAQLLAEKAELRTELLAQFNAILQTRDTRARAGREHVGCPLRHRQVHLTPSGA